MEQERLKQEEEHQCSHSCSHNSESEVIKGENLAYLEQDLTKFQQHLTQLINTINEILEELKYEIADLQAEE
jgi:hypothetical protein